jgi:crotonobetainyl-CoA:carnitine CoA-transferase CaiB-like acyl-CoA transferase
MESPALTGNLVGDLASGGLQAAIGILAAVIAREKTSEGQFVDISMTDGVVSMLSLYLGGYFLNNRMPDKSDMISSGAAPYYNLYETKDHKLLSIACSEPHFFANLCRVLECEELISYQADIEKADEIKDFFSQKFLDRTRDEWFEIMSKEEIAVARVNSLEELADDPQLKHRNMIIEIDHPEIGKVKQPGISIKLSDTPGSIRKLSPKSGEDTRGILLEFGYEHEEINALCKNGIISPVENVKSKNGK